MRLARVASASPSAFPRGSAISRCRSRAEATCFNTCSLSGNALAPKGPTTCELSPIANANLNSTDPAPTPLHTGPNIPLGNELRRKFPAHSPCSFACGCFHFRGNTWYRVLHKTCHSCFFFFPNWEPSRLAVVVSQTLS